MSNNAIARAAKNVRGDWYQGGMHGPNGGSCGLGHIQNVLLAEDIPFDDDMRYSAYEVASEVAMEQYPDRMGDRFASYQRYKDAFTKQFVFADFNDHPDTTEDEVAAVLEKAAVKWEEQIG